MRTELIHLLSNYTDVPPRGARVQAWTPKGYVRGTVTGRTPSGGYTVELEGPLNRLATLDYVSSSMAHGPHWALGPDWDAYELRTAEDWERFRDELFPYGWQKSVCRAERKPDPVISGPGALEQSNL